MIFYEEKCWESRTVARKSSIGGLAIFNFTKTQLIIVFQFGGISPPECLRGDGLWESFVPPVLSDLARGGQY